LYTVSYKCFQDSITEENKVVLVSINTQLNVNKEIKRLINSSEVPKIKNDIYVNGGKFWWYFISIIFTSDVRIIVQINVCLDIYNDVAKSVIKYSSLQLGIPTQV